MEGHTFPKGISQKVEFKLAYFKAVDHWAIGTPTVLLVLEVLVAVLVLVLLVVVVLLVVTLSVNTQTHKTLLYTQLTTYSSIFFLSLCFYQCDIFKSTDKQI